jgi:ATP-dependent Lon protease
MRETSTNAGRKVSSAPVIPLPDAVVFPLGFGTLTIRSDSDGKVLEEAAEHGRPVAFVAQRDSQARVTGKGQLYSIGSLAKVHELGVLEGLFRVALHGFERIRILDVTKSGSRLEATYEAAPEEDDSSIETRGLAQAARDLFVRMVHLDLVMPNELASVARVAVDPRSTAYVLASMTPLATALRQEILEVDSVAQKLRRLVDMLGHEVAVREISAKIRTDISSNIAKEQKEHILREQLESIHKELGESDPEHAAIDELRARLDALPLPDEVKKEADRELGRLRMIPAMSPEHGMLRTYLDWLIKLPWNKTTGTKIDLDLARRVLDEDHHDLDEVKKRVIEYLAVKRLREERAEVPAPVGRSVEPILCFLGPPGVGKTSLGQSIARAMGRKFTRVSLGGTHDEAEIRGHRRTYIGAMPGRILQAIARADSADPVFMLDEIDKLGVGFHGDPAAALLEVLDPVENHAFVDNYFGVPFDLSQVVFICTANTTDSIPRPLLDRMEVLQLAGYTESEKLEIAKKYVLPRQRSGHGLRPEELDLRDDAIARIISDYTREAGVRNLERHIASIVRKVGTRVVESGTASTVVAAGDLESYLGPQRLFTEVAERVDRPGVATALAWTPTGGGDILFVEATLVPSDEQRLLLTGMLGDVMRESAQAALSYLRSNASALGIDPGTFEHRAVHLHVPAGALPKDGPSAGVPILVALASIALGRPVRNDLAMTGEITLRGKVLPVGGIKEKILAAHRAGIKTIVLPKRNVGALEDVPAEVREAIEIVFVDSVDEALENALGITVHEGAGPATDRTPAPPPMPVVATSVHLEGPTNGRARHLRAKRRRAW